MSITSTTATSTWFMAITSMSAPVAVDASNPAGCTPGHACKGHVAGHAHGATCGHEAVPHGDHVDYLVDGHLHHAHAGHCDDHGALAERVIRQLGHFIICAVDGIIDR